MAGGEKNTDGMTPVQCSNVCTTFYECEISRSSGIHEQVFFVW